jgi:predicted HAD superfamily Cof-like phosphohydrolase
MKAEIEMVRQFNQKLDISSVQRLADVPEGNDESLKCVAVVLHGLARDLEKSARALPDDRRYLRLHLDCEELAEFADALAERDEVKALDALADREYVLLGEAVTFDLPLTSAFHEVHASNMTKEKQPADVDPNHGRVRVKGPNYRPPDLAGVLASYRDKQGRELSPFRRQLEAEKEQRRAAAEALKNPDPDRVHGRPSAEVTPVTPTAGKITNVEVVTEETN